MKTLDRKTEEPTVMGNGDPEPDPPEPEPPEPKRKGKALVGVPGAIASQMPENSRLTPLYFAFYQGGEQWWLFRCKCGKKTALILRKALYGQTRSCGCLRHEPWRANDRSKLSKDCR
jgi:hypothetical protein